MLRKIFNKKNLSKALKLFYKIGMATAGVTAIANPVSATVAGVGITAAAISSAVKDGKMGPLAGVINIAAMNIDKAKNNGRAQY